MARIFSKQPFKIALFRRARSTKTKPGVLICSDCGAIYFLKAWRHANSLPGRIWKASANARDWKVTNTTCPACMLVTNKMYGGEITVEDAPQQTEYNLRRLVQSYCRREYGKNCQHRLIDMKKIGNTLHITTTENQLAAKLARKIAQVFHVAHKITHIKEPSDVIRATIVFPRQLAMVA